jgi:HPt (histidine-containing phosphotransfer) domain-containing protein
VIIVGLTANAMQEDRDACLAAGMNDHLAKPVDRGRLLEKVARWGDASRAPAAEHPGTTSTSAVTERTVPELALDEALVADLRDALGDEPFRLLLGGTLASIVALKEELPKLDLAALRPRAHKLCGSAGAVGLTRLCEVAREVDEAIREGRDAALPTSRLGQLLAETVVGLEAYLQRFVSAAA